MSEKVTCADIDKIEKSATNIFHLLRHYLRLDHSYTSHLIGQGYEYYDYKVGKYVPSVITENDIASAYTTQGSKFFLNVPGMETPEKLIELIKKEAMTFVNQNILEWIEEERYKKTEFIYTHSENIGYKGVLDIDELTDEEKKKVKRVPRGSSDNVTINTISGIKKIPTNQLTIGLYERFDTGKLYITAFPGFPCPSLPSTEQSIEERKISEDFWKTKVFVE